ncbi:MAG: helix-turn-helix transcriptional regulator [Gammaproteobacteria bacterium]|nr:helix-turn-helix transcriptional regulator [Gammaproteobacteria bacterium]MCP4981560.1 helix-turn-helix transcriptional regulator [Gammaproteobacteria bacterium]
MAQSKALIKTLKRTLRAAHITYADIALRLEMSEANVKRLFATQSFTLQRLETICEMMNMDLGDLFVLLEFERRRIRHLTKQQEQELVADTKLLLIAICVRNQMNFDEMVNRYRLSETETIRHLAHLDRLGIIELLPGNRMKLLIDEHFEWLSDGPIERFYQQQIEEQFLNARFKSDVELRQFEFGLLGESASRIMIKKLRDLMREFTELHRADAHLPLMQRYSMGLLIAIRPWELEVFKPLMLEESATLASLRQNHDR